MALRAADARTDSTRERLLDAATQVFSELGYDGARVQEIARRAGLTTGAIYGNFRGKADLLVEAIGSRSAAELDELIPPARENGSGRNQERSVGELLIAMGKDLMAGHASDRQALLVEALVAGRRDRDLGELVRSSVAERARALTAVVEDARADGGLARSVDTETLVSFGLALALGSLLFKAIDIQRPDESRWAALITRLVGALVDEGPESAADRPNNAADTPEEGGPTRAV